MRLLVTAAVLGATLVTPAALFAQDPADPATGTSTTTTTPTATTTTPTEPSPVAEQPDVEVSSRDDRDKQGAQAAASSDVTIKNFAFHPKTLTISAGDTVTWTNKDSEPHDATSKKGNDKWTPTLDRNESGTQTFNQAGSFAYYCSIHPSMKGTIKVEGSGGGGGGGSSNKSDDTSSSGGGVTPTSPTGSTGSTGSSFTGPGSESSAGSGGGSGSLPATGLPVLPLAAVALLLIGLGGLVRWAATALYYRGW